MNTPVHNRILSGLVKWSDKFVSALAKKTVSTEKELPLPPSLPQADHDRLVELFNSGLYAELESLTHELVDQYPDSGFAWKVFGASLLAQGKNALPALQKAAALLPDDAQAHINLGLCLKDLGQLDEMVMSYRKALKIKPDNAAVHFNLGLALKDLGQSDEAVVSYRRALEINPEFVEAYCNLGAAQKDLGQLEEALASYRRALEIKPDFVQARINHGKALASLGHLDDAAASFRWALEIKPYDPEAHINLSNTLKDLGQLDEAVALDVDFKKKDLSLPGEVLVFAFADCQTFIISGAGDVDIKFKPWVWYAPNRPTTPGYDEKFMLGQFQDRGIATAGIDVGESFGSPRGNFIYSKFYEEMIKRGFSPRPVMLCRSRGGLMSLSWAEKNPDKVSAIAGIYPVSNLLSYPGLDTASNAYGMTTEELQKNIKAFNPIDNLSTLAEHRIPLFIIHGDADKVVPLDENSDLLKKRYTALGGTINLVILHGQGHDSWPGFQNQELVNFVTIHALANGGEKGRHQGAL